MSDAAALPAPLDQDTAPLPALPEPSVEATAGIAVIIPEDVPLAGPQLALWNALERLEALIDAETAELSRLKVTDYARLNEAKSRILLDVSRAVRGVEPIGADPRVRDKLVRLRSKLDRNRQAIAMHLDAVREIAETMTIALINADSDGTYSAGLSTQVVANGEVRALKRGGR